MAKPHFAHPPPAVAACQYRWRGFWSRTSLLISRAAALFLTKLAGQLQINKCNWSALLCCLSLKCFQPSEETQNKAMKQRTRMALLDPPGKRSTLQACARSQRSRTFLVISHSKRRHRFLFCVGSETALAMRKVPPVWR